jgi:hypothetical protein
MNTALAENKHPHAADAERRRRRILFLASPLLLFVSVWCVRTVETALASGTIGLGRRGSQLVHVSENRIAYWCAVTAYAAVALIFILALLKVVLAAAWRAFQGRYCGAGGT